MIFSYYFKKIIFYTNIFSALGNRCGVFTSLYKLDNMSGIWYNYVYDGFGRLKEVKINGETAVTVSETKDDDGVRTLVQTLADGTEYTVTSDAQGRTAEVKLGSEVIKNGFEYDDAGRCTGYIEFPGGANKKQHKFTYKDTETSHVSGDVTVTSLNDKKGKTTSTTYRFSESDAHVYNFAYENDFDEKLKSITHGNVVQTITHDKLGRQTESKIEGIYSKKATYLKYGDHTTDMISDLTYRISNGNTDREKYSYDKEGNISAIHENGRLKVKYTYDALNRLIREDNKELELTTTFEYDNGGNIIRQNEYAYSLADTDQLTDGTEIVYTYDGDRSDKLTDFNGESISYDENGCPLAYRDNNCEYTRGTLLSKYGANTFEYDADGIRTKKNGITFTYVDGKLIRQTGGSGTIDFIYGAGGAIGFKYNNTTYIYRRNLLGDVTHIYDTNGTLVARYVYDAWGNHKITIDVNGIGTLNPIRYRGYYYDTETGLYYLEARYYDPETGRFISQDSIKYIVSTNLTGLNLYAYCKNNPVMRVDPNGNLDWGTVLDFAITIGAGIAGGAVGTISGLKTYRNGVLSGKGHMISALEGLSVGVLSGTATFGAINNSVNAFYYNFISDGESDLNNSSYNIDNSGFKYLNRWDRLDYTKKETQQSTYNFNAWMYYSEYNFHMYAWLGLKGFYNKGGFLGGLAEAAKEANVEANDPFYDYHYYIDRGDKFNAYLRTALYLAVGVLGL